MASPMGIANTASPWSAPLLGQDGIFRSDVAVPANYLNYRKEILLNPGKFEDPKTLVSGYVNRSIGDNDKAQQ